MERRGGPDVTVGRVHLAITGLEPVVGLDRLLVEGRHTMRLELGTRRLPCRVNDHEVDRRLVLRTNGISGEHLEPAPVRSQGKQAAVRSNGNQHKRKLHPTLMALLE